MPFQKVYLVVERGPYGREVIEDRIQEVYSFGSVKGSLKEYWMHKSYHNTGIEAEAIHRNRAAAQFFLFL
jgi:hypothetical protein